MIANPDDLPGDTDLARAQNEAIYWRGRAHRADELANKYASLYALALCIAICEAGVIVALAVVRWWAGQ